jgi:23S rRNA (cytosine1962-C5)-methyltransferase
MTDSASIPASESRASEPLASELAGDTSVGLPTARVHLRPRKAKPFFARHPWVLESAVSHVDGRPLDGAVVDLLTERGDFLARGIYNSRSRIRVRLYSWDQNASLDADFWRDRIRRAVQIRQRLGWVTPDGAARLIFSEADELSGLIVDHFAGHLVVQVTALATAVRMDWLLPLLAEVIQPRSITVRGEGGIAKAEGIPPPSGIGWGQLPDQAVIIREHGLQYSLDLVGGQKTGFYLDQRDNRLAAARYMRDRRVLDMFCYCGGFGLAASRLGQAADVLGVDSSEPALRWAEQNAQLNGITNIRFQQAECFDMLDQLRAAGERFGAVILDPPKFTRNRFRINEALRAYHRINRLAVDLLEPDGILVTCSCSGSISRQDFLDMLGGVAEKSRRALQILEQRGAAPDHPVNLACPENEYLKCVICRVI